MLIVRSGVRPLSAGNSLMRRSDQAGPCPKATIEIITDAVVRALSPCVRIDVAPILLTNRETGDGNDKQLIPWNKGKLVGQKPPLKPKEIWAIRIRLQLADRIRDLALFNLAIDSKLRGCDLVRLRVADVCHGGTAASRAMVMQQKTKRPVQFEITEQTRDSVLRWITHARLTRDQYLFSSRTAKSPHLSTRQYARIVEGWIRSIGLDPSVYGTHSLRRAKASLIYRRTRNLRAVQLLLGHTKLDSTVRYLGIEVDDALEMAEQTDI